MMANRYGESFWFCCQDLWRSNQMRKVRKMVGWALPLTIIFCSVTVFKSLFPFNVRVILMQTHMYGPFQEHIIRYVDIFKDSDPVLILELAIGSLPTLSSNWTYGRDAWRH